MITSLHFINQLLVTVENGSLGPSLVTRCNRLNLTVRAIQLQLTLCTGETSCAPSRPTAAKLNPFLMWSMVSDGDRKSRNPAVQQRQQDTESLCIGNGTVTVNYKLKARRRTTERVYSSLSSLIDMEGSIDGSSRSWEKKNWILVNDFPCNCL